MLKIRTEQMKVLDDYMVREFEDRMVTHVGKFFAERCGILGEKGIREAIRYGIQRADSYGIVSERDLCLYIDVMFEFGRDFDKDRELPWAKRILIDRTLEDEPTEKMDRLYKAAVEKIHNAKGIQPESGD